MGAEQCEKSSTPKQMLFSECYRSYVKNNGFAAPSVHEVRKRKEVLDPVAYARYIGTTRILSNKGYMSLIKQQKESKNEKNG